MKDEITILSIDGGGIRGLIAAKFLAHLEKDLHQSLYDQFDMFAGSSIGSFIVLALSALQYDGEQILSLFNPQNIKNIFDKPLLGFLSPIYGTKYKGKGKRAVLDAIFKEKQFLNINKQTLITAYDIIHNFAVVFKSCSIDGSDAAYNPSIAEVADASSAAPTYFPTVKTSQHLARWLIDGGIVANDPTMCIVSEAIHMGYELDKIKVLSIGSGIRDSMRKNPQAYGKASQRWGGLGWLKHGIIDDLFSGSASAIEYEAAELLKENYFRVNHTLSPAQDELDNIGKDNLHALTQKGEAWYEECRDELLLWFMGDAQKLKKTG